VLDDYIICVLQNKNSILTDSLKRTRIIVW